MSISGSEETKPNGIGLNHSQYALSDLLIFSFPFFHSNSVSSKHFRIYSVIYDDEHVAEFPPLIYCEDQDSTNGTYVNDTLIGKLSSPRSPYLLRDGDVISIRPYWTFQFSQESLDEGNPLDSLQTQEIEVLHNRSLRFRCLTFP